MRWADVAAAALVACALAGPAGCDSAAGLSDATDAADSVDSDVQADVPDVQVADAVAQGDAAAWGPVPALDHDGTPPPFCEIDPAEVDALVAALTLISTKTWAEAPKEKASLQLAIGALVVLFVQIAFGAAARHFPDSLHGVMTHAGFSLFAAGAVTAAGAKASKHANPLLKRLGKACVHTVGLQMALGVAAIGVFFMTRDAETPVMLARALIAATMSSM